MATQRTIEEAFLLALLTRAVAIVTWVLAVTHVFMMMMMMGWI